MAEVKPFRGLRYNLQKTGDLARAVAPPYDVISQDEQARLHQRSAYNVVRLELGQDLPLDSERDNKYTRAAALLTEWRKSGALAQEERPAFYLVKRQFTYHGQGHGQGYTRTSVCAAVRLEEPGKGSIKPHEHTNARPKADRLALLQATRCNISPVMLLYRERGSEVRDLLARAAQRPPTVSSSLGEGERVDLWAVTEGDLCRKLGACFTGRNLYIADGHHRYETAYAYSQQASSKNGSAAGYVMAHLVSTDDPGLLDLPYHRVLRNLGRESLQRVYSQVSRHFQGRYTSQREQPIDVSLKELAGNQQAIFGLVERVDGPFARYVPRNQQALDATMPADRVAAWRKLSPSVLSEVVIKPALGMSEEEAQRAGLLEFVKDQDDVLAMLRDGGQVGVFTKAVPLSSLIEVAEAGQRFPPKSTYFYPKLLTGLVMHSLEGEEATL